MQISNNLYTNIRYQVVISDFIRQFVTLSKKGHEYTGLCPFHMEKTPSFTVNNNKKFFYCFGCGETGDVIKFASKIKNLSYKDAAIHIAELYNIPIPKLSKNEIKLKEESENLYQILDITAKFFTSNIPHHVIEYLNNRGIDNETIKNFNIGYVGTGFSLEQYLLSKDISREQMIKAGIMRKKEDGKFYHIFNHRIMFPIYNLKNKIIGFGGRTIENKGPKYINSPDTIIFKKQETLYGHNIASTYITKSNSCILVEGYMDVIALHKAGFKNSVASLGTATGAKHVLHLWQTADEVIISLDGDFAGQNATKRLINGIMQNLIQDKSIAFINMPAGYDPDNIINDKNNNISFDQLLENRQKLSEKIWTMNLAEFTNNNIDLNIAENKSKLEHNIEQIIAPINDFILKKNFRSFFRTKLWELTKNQYKKGKNYNSHTKNEYSQNDNLNVINITNTQNDFHKDLTELELNEYKICTLMAYFPDKFKAETLHNELLTLQFSNDILNSFKDWFLDLLNQDKILLDYELIYDSAKTAGFNQVFLVISRIQNEFLNDINKIDDSKDNINIRFKILCKIIYYLKLNEEYNNTKTLNNKDINELDDDAKHNLEQLHLSYIQEMIRTKNEIDELFNTL